MVTFISSVGQTTSANAIILMYTAPLWVLLAAPLVTGDRAHRRELYAAAIAMTGMAVIIGGTLLAPGSNTEVSGVMMGLAAGLCFAGVSLALRHLRTADPIAVICVNNIFTAIVLLAAAGIAGDVSIRGWPILLLVALGLFQIAAPYVIYCHALQHMTPQRATLVCLAEPIMNPIWVWLFLSEVPSLATLIGGAIVIGGLVLIFRTPKAVTLRAVNEPAPAELQTQIAPSSDATTSLTSPDSHKLSS